jgi:hypothetical protein
VCCAPFLLWNLRCDANRAWRSSLSRSVGDNRRLECRGRTKRYKKALQGAGLTVVGERNRRDFALAFFADLRAKTAPLVGHYRLACMF